jgi:hypothetical protein
MTDGVSLAKSGKQLQDFSKKLRALKDEWSSGIDIKTRKRVKVDSSHQLKVHTKGTKTNLRISLPRPYRFKLSEYTYDHYKPSYPDAHTAQSKNRCRNLEWSQA